MLEYTLQRASVVVMPATTAGALFYIRNLHPVVRYQPENTGHISDTIQLTPIVPGPRVPTAFLSELKESRMGRFLMQNGHHGRCFSTAAPFKAEH